MLKVASVFPRYDEVYTVRLEAHLPTATVLVESVPLPVHKCFDKEGRVAASLVDAEVRGGLQRLLEGAKRLRRGETKKSK